MLIIKFRLWLESNLGPLVLEANAVPTELQPLPLLIVSFIVHLTICQYFYQFYYPFINLLVLLSLVRIVINAYRGCIGTYNSYFLSLEIYILIAKCLFVSSKGAFWSIFSTQLLLNVLNEHLFIFHLISYKRNHLHRFKWGWGHKCST